MGTNIVASVNGSLNVGQQDLLAANFHRLHIPWAKVANRGYLYEVSVCHELSSKIIQVGCRSAPA
jgi:hypothetical protein